MRYRIILILLVVILSAVGANSQGFNWQYSSRLPMKYPEFFIGINAGVSFINNNGNIRLDEGEVFDCCKFSSGSGWGNSYGLAAEYWYFPDMALFAHLNYTMDGHTFTKQRMGEIRVTDTLFYENELKSSIDYLNLEIGAKKDFPASHFHYGLSMMLGITLSNSNKITEKVLKPVYFPWSERIVSQGRISDLTKFYFLPKVRLGYDIDLGLSTYSTISLTAGIPVINITDNAEWKSWQFGLEIVINRGIF